MSGNDVTDEELQNAEKFLAIGRKGREPQPEYRISHEMLVRMLAWYGSVRANGDGSGHFVVNGKPLQPSTAVHGNCKNIQNIWGIVTAQIARWYQ